MLRHADRRVSELLILASPAAAPQLKSQRRDAGQIAAQPKQAGV